MARPRRIEDLVGQLLEAIRPRAKSLIVTVFGDAIIPHGGSIWLGSFIDLMANFDMTDRIVRTSVFRLIKDDWMMNTPIGRRSFYRLTEYGHERNAAAERRIYAPLIRRWDHNWHMLLIAQSSLDAETRERLRRELQWLGFGMISPTVLTHASYDEAAVNRLLAELGVSDKIVLMKATHDTSGSQAALRDLVREYWDIAQLEANYDDFLSRHRPVWETLNSIESLDPRQSFVIRTLLIHDFRRILLRDPMLPAELLPADWVGQEARLLTRNIYRLVQQPSESFLLSTVDTPNGPLPDAAPYFQARFGGLKDEEASTTPIPTRRRAAG
jgi:phenylacetic acid degradation operon negative regulatory protein